MIVRSPQLYPTSRIAARCARSTLKDGLDGPRLRLRLCLAWCSGSMSCWFVYRAVVFVVSPFGLPVPGKPVGFDRARRFRGERDGCRRMHTAECARGSFAASETRPAAYSWTATSSLLRTHELVLIGWANDAAQDIRTWPEGLERDFTSDFSSCARAAMAARGTCEVSHEKPRSTPPTRTWRPGWKRLCASRVSTARLVTGSAAHDHARLEQWRRGELDLDAL